MIVRLRDLPFSSPLSEERREGRYHCRGCDRPLFDAGAKVATSTGWPTFTHRRSRSVAVATSWAAGKAGVRCAHCAAPLGDLVILAHSARYGRYSIDGSALSFAPSGEPA